MDGIPSVVSVVAVVVAWAAGEALYPRVWPRVVLFIALAGVSVASWVWWG